MAVEEVVQSYTVQAFWKKKIQRKKLYLSEAEINMKYKIWLNSYHWIFSTFSQSLSTQQGLNVCFQDLLIASFQYSYHPDHMPIMV
jgi:hypothetical protein